MKIYGPYTREDGRQHIVLYENGKRRTLSYARWLMGEPDGEVHHKDGNPLNNELSNLEVLPKKEHIKRHRKSPEMYEFVCPACGEQASKRLSQVKGNWKKGKSGPFCNKKCARKYQLAGVFQSAENVGLNPIQCEFESHRPY